MFNNTLGNVSGIFFWKGACMVITQDSIAGSNSHSNWLDMHFQLWIMWWTLPKWTLSYKISMRRRLSERSFSTKSLNSHYFLVLTRNDIERILTTIITQVNEQITWHFMRTVMKQKTTFQNMKTCRKIERMLNVVTELVGT